MLSLTTFGTLRPELRDLTRSPQLGEPNSLAATYRSCNGLGSDNDDPEIPETASGADRDQIPSYLFRLTPKSVARFCVGLNFIVRHLFTH